MDQPQDQAVHPFRQTIQSFLTDASSSSPTPGGGSVAALVAALGSAMSSMVANLTQGEKFAEVTDEMEALASRMQSAIGRFEQLLLADATSFDGYMAALRMPKQSDEEKARRREALQSATVAATEVPLTLADECYSALEDAHRASPGANKNVLSDLGIAAMLLEAAGQCALITADINIPSIKDATIREGFQNRRDSLAAKLTEVRNDTVAQVRRRMAGE